MDPSVYRCKQESLYRMKGGITIDRELKHALQWAWFLSAKIASSEATSVPRGWAFSLFIPSTMPAATPESVYQDRMQGWAKLSSWHPVSLLGGNPVREC